MVNNPLHIVISGGGIAGLSCAIFLAKLGARVTIYEQAKELSTVGAGIQLSPNAIKVLAALDLTSEISKYAIKPTSLTMLDGISLASYITLPINAKDTPTHLSYYLITRHKLQQILLDKLATIPQIELKLNHPIKNFKPNGNKVILNLNQETMEADLFISCDGVWSAAREKLLPNEIAYYSGYNVWRLHQQFEEQSISFFANKLKKQQILLGLAHNQHLVIYPTTDNGYINLVAIAKDSFNNQKNWEEIQNSTEVASYFQKWNHEFKKLFISQLDWKKYPLYVMKNPNYYGKDNCLLLGDAAHAMHPFAAQGAAMALEDAAYLYTSFKQFGINQQAIDHFIKYRLPRIKKIQQRSIFNQKIYHATGLLKIGRDLAFKLRKQESFMKDLEWIYNYNALDL